MHNFRTLISCLLVAFVLVFGTGFVLLDNAGTTAEKSIDYNVEVEKEALDPQSADLQSSFLDLTETAIGISGTNTGCQSALVANDCNSDPCEVNGTTGACCLIGGTYFSCSPCGAFMPVAQ